MARSYVLLAFTLLSCLGCLCHGFTSQSHVTTLLTKRTANSMVCRFASQQQQDEAATKQALEADIQANLQILYHAAETKAEDSDAVFDALLALEKQMRKASRMDDSIATRMQEQLTGSWKLIFTTGTVKTQERAGGRRINYFPLTAIQSFDTAQETIENGIYLFGDDWAALKFLGTMDFNLKSRRLSFDFDRLQALSGFVDIPLKQGQAAQLGSTSGLGSESNVANAAKKEKPAFFNWISADEQIATARGAGGGLALWKRMQ